MDNGEAYLSSVAKPVVVQNRTKKKVINNCIVPKSCCFIDKILCIKLIFLVTTLFGENIGVFCF